jgi:LPXTG-motif cell wall-anchored protein
MTTFEYLSSQNLMILVAGALVLAIALAWFLRKRSNRHPMEGRQERNVGADLDAGRKAPDHSPRI